MREKKSCLKLGKVIVTVLSILMIMPFTTEAGSLSGQIIDQTNGSSLVNAIVKIVPSDGSKATSIAASIDGIYKFENIVAGKYTIVVTYIGFSTWEKTDVEIGDSPVTVSAELMPTSINMNSISVSASRRPEKIVDAPASVSLVSAAEIAERSTLTPTEHLKGLPAVDVASTGLNQSNVVVRGFNNIFSGALMVLTDNRIARVPSLRFNAYNFMTTANEDIEQIEIVSGPGSALYGPNSANGVMHIITKSPFASQGGSFSVGSGERGVNMVSGRYAGLLNDKVGFKLSSQFYKGEDWEHFEPSEPSELTLYKRTTTLNGNFDDTVKTLFASTRDFDIKKLSTDGRIDYVLGDNSSLILNSGFNQSTGIELTGLGAGQAIDWTYNYTQARFNYKDLFVQAFVNASDAGDTYLLETGQLIVDKSKLWVSQIQHRYEPNEKSSLTYGIDALMTRPNTENTINGRNEDIDNINEYGVYVQGDYKLSEKTKFVGAFRVDDNDQLEDMVYSPRAGLVYQPDANNNYRFTYNRAFTTPDNNNLFLDLLISGDPYGIGAGFAPALGFNPAIDIRVQGVPESGFHWSYDDAGNPRYKSPFAPAGGAYGYSDSAYIDLHDPIFNNVMWAIGSGAVLSGFSDKMDQLEAGGILPPGYAALMTASVSGITPSTISGVNNNLMTFNPDTRSFDQSSLNDIADIERMQPTITQTLEFGYKGIINNSFQFSFDAYRTKKDNFVGPLTVETPNVFFDPATLGISVGTDVATYYATSASATDSAMFLLFESVAFGGNGDGDPIPELTSLLVGGVAPIPFGVVTPEEQYDPNAVLVTYRNFGEVTYYGADLAFTYHLDQNWDLGGTYSYVSKNFFAKNAEQVHDIHLNAPKNKFGVSLRYVDARDNLSLQLRYRWVEGFDMASPFFGTSVKTYDLLDLNFGVDIVANTHLSVTVQNVLNNIHSEFVGGAKMGRLGIMKITQSF